MRIADSASKGHGALLVPTIASNLTRQGSNHCLAIIFAMMSACHVVRTDQECLVSCSLPTTMTNASLAVLQLMAGKKAISAPVTISGTVTGDTVYGIFLGHSRILIDSHQVSCAMYSLFTSLFLRCNVRSGNCQNTWNCTNLHYEPKALPS
eukprot:scaffold11948_cov126-Cylindrotheca_fusiformis.AAC.2